MRARRTKRARQATPAARYRARRAAYATAVHCACGAGESFDVLIIDWWAANVVKRRLRVKCGSADMRICGLNNG